MFKLVGLMVRKHTEIFVLVAGVVLTTLAVWVLDCLGCLHRG